MHGMSFSEGLKNKFKTTVVNVPSVFEPLKFYCTFKFLCIIFNACINVVKQYYCHPGYGISVCINGCFGVMVKAQSGTMVVRHCTWTALVKCYFFWVWLFKTNDVDNVLLKFKTLP